MMYSLQTWLRVLIKEITIALEYCKGQPPIDISNMIENLKYKTAWICRLDQVPLNDTKVYIDGQNYWLIRRSMVRLCGSGSIWL